MSTALVLITESPMIAMEKVIFGRKQAKPKSLSNDPKEMTCNSMKKNKLQENEKIATIHL